MTAVLPAPVDARPRSLQVRIRDARRAGVTGSRQRLVVVDEGSEFHGRTGTFHRLDDVTGVHVELDRHHGLLWFGFDQVEPAS